MSAYEALPWRQESGYRVEIDYVGTWNWIWMWVRAFLPLTCRKMLHQYSPMSQAGEQVLHQIGTSRSRLTPPSTQGRHWRMASHSVRTCMTEPPLRQSSQPEDLGSPAQPLHWACPLLFSSLSTATTTVQSGKALGWWPPGHWCPASIKMSKKSFL